MNGDVSKTGPAKNVWSWNWLWKRLFNPWRFFAVGVIHCIFGLVMVFDAQLKIDRGQRSLHWPTTEGTVVRSTIEPVVVRNRQGRESRQYMAASIECVYQARGRNRVFSWQESESIFAVVEKYPVGRRVKIYYDPEVEDETLRPGVQDADRSLRLWSALVIAQGAVIMFFSLRKIRRTPAG